MTNHDKVIGSPQDRKVQVTVLGAVGGAAMGSTGGGVRDAQASYHHKDVEKLIWSC